MTDEERIDGTALVERDEPGSDDLLLRGLIRALAERLLDDDDEGAESSDK
jgi:hypothetical protein